jgi:hypothetical protein
VASAQGGTFDNIAVSGSLNVTYTGTDTDNLNVGGVIGIGDSVAISGSNSKVSLTVTGPGYSTSAGGIAGYITQSTVTDSHTTTGDITVSAPSGTGQYDVYQAFAGGLVGYSGNSSKITLSSSKGQSITSNNSAYPYAGGLVGYNYGLYQPSPEPPDPPVPPSNGSTITQSYSTNTVTATATNNGIPYAGGLAGYNSGGDATTGFSLIRDCYAWGDVTAATGGQYAWAGGVSGAVAANAILERCYGTGNVKATSDNGVLPYPQPGIDEGSAAGGVVGYTYNYYYNASPAGQTYVMNSVGLNGLVTANGANSDLEAHRVVGHNGDDPYASTITDNLGYTSMSLIPPPTQLDPTLDGTDTVQYPAQSVYEGIGWTFGTIWVMDTVSGYPKLVGVAL